MRSKEEMNEWRTVSHKGPSKEERSARRAQGAQAALAQAQSLLEEYAQSSGANTVCVFLGADGQLIAYGDSGWRRPKDANKYINNYIIKQRNQRNGYGEGCAEQHALYTACDEHKDHMIKYSLAYSNSDGFKPACGTCSKLLREKGIEDLYHRL